MRILLAEDNENNRDMLSRRLIRRGYTVLIAEDGQKAVEMTVSEAPDLILGGLDSITRFGSENGITAYALGATTCNVGSCWADWFATTPSHPVFGQNLFRLRYGRFEQIGQSWVAHRFFALSAGVCSPACLPTDGTHLGVSCSTSNSANLTGGQPYLGPKSGVNPATGAFDFPFSEFGATGDAIFKRLQVHEQDLDPALNSGASYFIEGQNVSADDAAAGSSGNNASYRHLALSDAGGVFNLALVGTTIGGEPAIHAWAESDPSVSLEIVTVPGDGTFYVASAASYLGSGIWHYEYAVQNFDSNRGAMRFVVPLAGVPFFFGFGKPMVASLVAHVVYGLILAAITAPFAAMLVQMAISRTREYSADRRGAEISGNPMWLASALAKIARAAGRMPMISAQRNPATAHLFIINPLSGERMDNLFSTHPGTENRIAALQDMAGQVSGDTPELEPPADNARAGPWSNRKQQTPPRSRGSSGGPWD